jgi:hypothetical protein
MNRNDTRDEFDVRLDDVLRYVLAIGAVLVLLLPAARGFSQTLGWLPLWLLVMPLTALWAVHGFRLPRRGEAAASSASRRRRSGPQARRRVRPGLRRAVSRAA